MRNKLLKGDNNIKVTGATFTPITLADFLSERISTYLSKKHHLTIMDPACGDGRLLLSIANYLDKETCSFVGYDTNESYINTALINFKQKGMKTSSILYQDFLEISATSLDMFSSHTDIMTDVIIANPPYVRTQLLGSKKAQQIAKAFHLSGKIDLYYPFLIGMTNLLNTGGILGVITSNRYLSTKSGRTIRHFLHDHYEILEIIDLGDTKIFDAAVLPAIFIGKKKSFRQPQIGTQYSQIYEAIQTPISSNIIPKKTIFDILHNHTDGYYSVDGKTYKYSIGQLEYVNDDNHSWHFSNTFGKQWLKTIHANTAFYIRDKFKVRVGVKSCADNVFINSQWDQEDQIPEPELMKSLISRDNIQRWSCTDKEFQQVLYPHYDNNGTRAVYNLEQFPRAKSYLEKHKEQLIKRQYLIEANRLWYEMWVPQNPAYWKYPKIVFPDISTEAQFCMDYSGSVVNGNCYWIFSPDPEEVSLLLLIEGVANSALMAKYHDLMFNNKLYSGRRRYLSQYVENYPMPDLNNIHSQNIIQITQTLNEINDDTMVATLYEQLNKEVPLAFGITD